MKRFLLALFCFCYCTSVNTGDVHDLAFALEKISKTVVKKEEKKEEKEEKFNAAEFKKGEFYKKYQFVFDMLPEKYWEKLEETLENPPQEENWLKSYPYGKGQSFANLFEDYQKIIEGKKFDFLKTQEWLDSEGRQKLGLITIKLFAQQNNVNAQYKSGYIFFKSEGQPPVEWKRKQYFSGVRQKGGFHAPNLRPSNVKDRKELVGIYKIHLMSKKEDIFMVLERIFMAAREDKEFGELINTFKVIANSDNLVSRTESFCEDDIVWEESEKYPGVWFGKDEEGDFCTKMRFPVVVIYPAWGKKMYKSWLTSF